MAPKARPVRAAYLHVRSRRRRSQVYLRAQTQSLKAFVLRRSVSTFASPFSSDRDRSQQPLTLCFVQWCLHLNNDKADVTIDMRARIVTFATRDDWLCECTTRHCDAAHTAATKSALLRPESHLTSTSTPHPSPIVRDRSPLVLQPIVTVSRSSIHSSPASRRADHRRDAFESYGRSAELAADARPMPAAHRH